MEKLFNGDKIFMFPPTPPDMSQNMGYVHRR